MKLNISSLAIAMSFAIASFIGANAQTVNYSIALNGDGKVSSANVKELNNTACNTFAYIIYIY